MTEAVTWAVPDDMPFTVDDEDPVGRIETEWDLGELPAGYEEHYEKFVGYRYIVHKKTRVVFWAVRRTEDRGYVVGVYATDPKYSTGSMSLVAALTTCHAQYTLFYAEDSYHAD